MASRIAVIAFCLLASIGTSALAATASPPAPSAFAQELAAAAIIEQSLYSAVLFNITTNYLNTTGLSLALGSGANLTLLAPNDDAWHNVTKQPRGAELMKALKGPDAELVLINTLLYHVIPAYYTSVLLLVSIFLKSNVHVTGYDAEGCKHYKHWFSLWLHFAKQCV